MATLSSTKCCGVAEIDGISFHPQPIDVLRNLSWYFKNGTMPEVPFITFTGVVEKSLEDRVGHARSTRTDNYGETLAQFLEANNLGKVIRSTPRRSWSKNVIALWIWEVDYATLIPFLEGL